MEKSLVLRTEFGIVLTDEEMEVLAKYRKKRRVMQDLFVKGGEEFDVANRAQRAALNYASKVVRKEYWDAVDKAYADVESERGLTIDGLF